MFDRRFGLASEATSVTQREDPCKLEQSKKTSQIALNRLSLTTLKRLLQEMFQPFEDRVFDGESGLSEDKVLVCDVMDVEDLIYFYEVRPKCPCYTGLWFYRGVGE